MTTQVKRRNVKETFKKAPKRQRKYTLPVSLEAQPDDTPKLENYSTKAGRGENLIEQLYFGVAEETVSESSYHSDSFMRPYNPDDLFQKRNDYSIYEDMLHDDQISVCLNIKKDLVLGSGADIVCDDNDELSLEIKACLENAIDEDPKTPFSDQLQEIISAYEFGFSLTEKVFQTRPDGKLTLKYLKTRHPSTWLIHTDEKGNIEKYEQHGSRVDKTIKAESLIHYINNPRFQNPYGRSDLRAAYNAWFIKRQIIRYYAIFLEKAASPTPVARYDKNTPEQAKIDIHNAIKAFQTKTALTIPKEIELEFLDAKNTGEVYVKGINIFNMFIGRALLIPDLLGFQGSETSGGSYALGKDQIGMLFKHIYRRRESLERVVNKEIIYPLVVYNYGFIDHYPKFKLRPISDEHIIELARLWSEVAKGKIYKPTEEEINHFRKLAHFPQGDVSFYAPEPTGNPFGPSGSGQPINEGNQDGNNIDDNDDTQTQDKGETPSEEDALKEGEGQDQSESGTSDKGNQETLDDKKDDAKSQNRSVRVPSGEKKDHAKLFSPVGPYDKKVDYSAIASQMDATVAKAKDQATVVIQEIFADLIDQIEKKKIIQAQRPDKIEDLKVRKLKDIKLIVKGVLRDAYQGARTAAQRELLKGNFASPLPDDAFLSFLETEAFSFVGDWAYNITKKAKVALLAAIRDGIPLSAVISLIEEEGTRDALVSIERFSRTKTTDVMNQGRLAFFNESGVVAAYQYSAILDDRTTAICSGLHGKVFKAGTQPTPPLHFNCRSILVPITKYEEFEVDEKVGKTPISQFIDENKGSGFSTN